MLTENMTKIENTDLVQILQNLVCQTSLWGIRTLLLVLILQHFFFFFSFSPDLEDFLSPACHTEPCFLHIHKEITAMRKIISN